MREKKITLAEIYIKVHSDEVLGDGAYLYLQAHKLKVIVPIHENMHWEMGQFIDDVNKYVSRMNTAGLMDICDKALKEIHLD